MKFFKRRGSLLFLIMGCASALAQHMTDEQRSAIRNACRGDHMKMCASVPTGGRASPQYPQQHSQDV